MNVRTRVDIMQKRRGEYFSRLNARVEFVYNLLGRINEIESKEMSSEQIFQKRLYIYIYAHEEDWRYSWGRINRISDCGIECKYLRIRYFNVIPNLKRCCVEKSRDLIIWNNLRNDLRKSTFWYFVCHMKMIASIKISYYIHRVLREKSITKVQMSSFPRSNATRQQVII